MFGFLWVILWGIATYNFYIAVLGFTDAENSNLVHQVAVPGSVAVVIGAGGLGHVGIQILRALSPATVVALDLAEDKLDFAKDVGAHHAFLSDDAAVERVRELSGGRGAVTVFDFVGVQPTMDLGAKMVAVSGDQVMVGVGSGTLPVGFLDRQARP